MELVDREKACQEILATRKYIEGPSENAQDNWILQYLKERLHKNMNESYEIWKEVFESKHEEDSNGWRGVFGQKWENLKGVTISPVKNRKIYQREIDLINSCQLKMVWQKEILLAMVCYFKFTGKHKVSDLGLGDYAKYVGKYSCQITPNCANDLLNEALRVGLFKQNKVEQFDSICGENYCMSVYEFDDKRKEGDVVCFEIWNAYDVIKYDGWFDTAIKCMVCGKLFLANHQTRKNVCENCQRIERKNKITLAAKLCMRKKKTNDNTKTVDYII